MEDIRNHFNYHKNTLNVYLEIENYIIGVYNHSIIDEETTCPHKLFWNGRYYQDLEKNYELMKKYYSMAIEKGNSTATHSLGVYYQLIEKDYELMTKYYLMGIENGDKNAMHNLDSYYKKIEKDYVNFYKLINEIKNPNKIILNKIEELKINKRFVFI